MRLNKYETQFERRDPNKEQHVIIGLDFGTACTKVVVRVPDAPGSPTFAIPLNRGMDDCLLSSHLWVTADGRYELEEPPEGGSLLHDIKLSLMTGVSKTPSTGPDVVLRPADAAAAYLALVLRRVRHWFLTKKRAAFGGRTILWGCNLGAPTEVYEGKDVDVFKRVLRKAWVLSVTSDMIGDQAIHAVHQSAIEFNFDATDDGCDLGVIPEFAAEVAVYSRAPERQPGLYLMMDVGAGTLDLTAFIIHRQDLEDKLPILGAEVVRLGAHELHRRWLDVLRDYSERHPELCDAVAELERERTQRPGAALPSGEAIRTRFPIARGDIEKVDQKFREDCRKSVLKLVVAVRKNRDPHSDRFQADGELPLFLCGGGAHIRLFKDVTQDIDKGLRDGGVCSGGCRARSMPGPKNLTMVGGVTVDRVGVAWGLSLRHNDIGLIMRASEIEDIVAPSAEHRRCPCRGNNDSCPDCNGSGQIATQGRGTKAIAADAIAKSRARNGANKPKVTPLPVRVPSTEPVKAIVNPGRQSEPCPICRQNVRHFKRHMRKAHPRR